MASSFKYFAFISYSSHDLEWGKRLQRKLEHYRLPSTLCSEHNLPRTPMKPVFFAPTDIQPGGLSEELKERLEASRNLIVICSPHSAQSEWVGKEIEYFHSLGRTQNIHFFIVEGIPLSGNPATECYNPIIKQLGIPEILGANIHEKIYRIPKLNRDRAYVQLISKLLGIEFDAIWQRHRRRLIDNLCAWTLSALAVLFALYGVWKMNQNFDAVINLVETSVHNENLPPLKNAVVTMFLDNETKSDTIRTLDAKVVFANIPHRLLNKNIRFTIVCNDFIDVDTMVKLTKNTNLAIRRDPTVYGDVRFSLWNSVKERLVPDVNIEIEGYKATSDEKGYVELFIPLQHQKTSYEIIASDELEKNIIIMPSGENDVLIVK